MIYKSKDVGPLILRLLNIGVFREVFLILFLTVLSFLYIEDSISYANPKDLYFPMTPKIILLILLYSLFAETVFGKDFYVAPRGDDAHPGTEQEPLGTVYGAKKAVRKYRQENPGDRMIRVIFKSGTYYLNAPLELGPEDGGDKAVAVTYMAAPGEKVIFSGGKKIMGFEKVKDNLWKAHIPEVSQYQWYFEPYTLYHQGQLYRSDQHDYPPLPDP